MKYRNTVLLALATLLYTANVGCVLKLVLWLAVWYFSGGKHWMYLFRNTIGRDYR
jgi:hypothetical protein